MASRKGFVRPSRRILFYAALIQYNKNTIKTQTICENFMLELRPNCEHCNKDLPPESKDAMICSFECTFCRECVHQQLQNVCPNCGGNFVERPIRPAKNGRNENDLVHYPCSKQRRFRPVDIDKHLQLLKSQPDPQV